MKHIIIILLLFFSVFFNQLDAQNDGTISQAEIQKIKIAGGKNISLTTDPEILKFYTCYSQFTEPGEFVYMFENLPDSLSALCRLIKSQLIHPVADLPKYREIIAAERSYEDLKYPTVKTILAGLKSYNPDGLIMNRKPEERLVISCRYHAILLASILKYKGIPARIRYGFASYLYPGYHIYHVVCEVWNKKESRWILVDPDRQLIDLTSQQFEFSNDAWLKYRHAQLKPETYGVPGWWGAHPILDVICHDLASILGNEYIYFDRPPVSADSTMEVKNLNSAQFALLDKISELMENTDDNFNELKTLYGKEKELQFSSYNRNKDMIK